MDLQSRPELPERERETGLLSNLFTIIFSGVHSCAGVVSALWACTSLLCNLRSEWPTCAALRLEPVSRALISTIDLRHSPIASSDAVGA
jgi:hypothetical protein